MENELFASMRTATSGLRVQSTRLRVIAENVANADTTAATSSQTPFRRKTITFKSALDEATGASLVEVGRIRSDPAPFKLEYDPGHPAADADGYVKRPNVNALIEMVDMREAGRSYEANLKSIETSRDMFSRALDILR